MERRLLLVVLALAVGIPVFLSWKVDPGAPPTPLTAPSIPLAPREGAATPERKPTNVVEIAPSTSSGQAPMENKQETSTTEPRREPSPVIQLEDVDPDNTDAIRVKGPNIAYNGFEAWQINPNQTTLLVMEVLGIPNEDHADLNRRLMDVDRKIQTLMSAHQHVEKDTGDGAATVVYGPFGSEAVSLREEVEMALRIHARNPDKIDEAMDILRVRYFGFGEQARRILKETGENGKPKVTISQYTPTGKLR